MSALPLIEAVRHAGATIALQGDRLRLSAPEPLPGELLEEVRLHKADLIDQLRSAARPLLREPPAGPPRPGTAAPTETIATGPTAWPASGRCRGLGITVSTPGSN
jgi:TubC N-terminal docking domain